MKLTSLSDCEQALLQFVPPARSQRQKYSLKRMSTFMEYLGNPQNSYQVVHIAGTSGKTSTCYYTAALLQSAGLKVGLTISPHITRVNERVQINLSATPPNLFASELTLFLELVQNSTIELTYFEVLMAFAYWFFARQKVEIAVIETGLGGLLDGSNVVNSKQKVCVITDIGFDHTGVLGKTLTSIAKQKAGIIGQANTVFSYHQPPSIMKVITGACAKVNAQLHIQQLPAPDASSILPLFQQHNAKLAFAVSEWLLFARYQKVLSKSALSLASRIVIPARMELFTINKNTIVVDGAHNPQKIKAFTESYKYKYPQTRPVVLFACIKGPDFKIEHNIQQLLKLNPQKIIITTFQSLQDMQKISVEPRILSDKFAAAGFANCLVINDPLLALGELISLQAPMSVIVGSLYLIFELRQRLVGLADRQL